MKVNIREKIVGIIQEHPKQVLAFTIMLLLILIPGLFSLKSDFSYRAWYSEDDPLLVFYDKFENKFGNDDSVIIAIESKNSLLNPKDLKLIYDTTQEMWKIPGIIRVDSLANYDAISGADDEIDIGPLISEELSTSLSQSDIPVIKEKIKNKKLVINYLISENEKMAIIRGIVKPSLKQRVDNKELILEARALKESLEKKWPELNFYFAGTATFIHIFTEITERDVGILMPLLMTIFIVILYFIYRNKSGIIIPLCSLFSSAIMMLGLSGYFEHSITTISSAAPSILLTVAIADAIHILTVYFFALSQGHNNEEAVRYSLIKNFYPTLLTSLTTSIGFLSFSNSLIKSIAELGVEVGFGVVFAWISTYFLIGPLLVLRPKFIKSNSIPPQKIKKQVIATELKISNTTKSYVLGLFKYRYAIAFVSLALFIASILGAKNLEVNLNPDAQFKHDHPYKVAMRSLEKNMGSMSQVEFLIETNTEDGAKDPEFLKKVESFENWLNDLPYIRKTISLNDIIKELNLALQGGASEHFAIPNTKEEVGQNLFFYSLGLPPGRELNDRISLKSDAVRLTAIWSIITSKQANEEIQKMELKAKELGLTAKVTGKMPLFHELTPYVVKSFIDSFTIALIAIFLILIVVLKSLKLGLLALVPNIFPLILGAGVYSLTGEYLDIASVLIVSVCLGIAVDDSIHFLFEYQKYRKENLNIKRSFEIIFTNTAPSLFNTTLLIVIGFGSFVIADYIPNAKFGIMVSLVLSIALIADFVVLPALLYIFEKDKPCSDV
ncbi:MAG: putative RND superfamily exporter protein [Bacteriovoracaceae bacterium]|jgi:predicted RND superfamily exporter protein